MGYYTTFKLTVLGLDGKTDKSSVFDTTLRDAKNFQNLTDHERENYKPEYIAKLEKAAKAAGKVSAQAYECLEYVDSGEAIKWYDHETDMRNLSKAFPDFIFQLEGSGEESGDIWVKWFNKGQMQGGKAKLVLPALDLATFE